MGDVAVLKRLLSCEEGQKILREMGQRADEPDEARVVNRYAAAIPRQRTHSAPKLCPVAVRWGARKQSHGPCTALERLMRSSETVDLCAGSTVNW